jgi:pimeloyl-ACP methyl ester carboxylesterase
MPSPFKVAGILLATALTGCLTFGDAKLPIPTVSVPAPNPGPERTLIVLLPGFGNDHTHLQSGGVAEAIHEVWPEADVLLAGAAYDYYRTGTLVQRLHEGIVKPARQDGYTRILLAGASMGGMGVLLYETLRPGSVDGLVLFAPFLGSNRLLREIRKAGGPQHWNPGELGNAVDGDNYQRHVWKTIQSWTGDSDRAQSVWLVCGDRDRLLEDVRVLAPVLPESNYLELPGGHTWELWRRSAQIVFARIRDSR